MNICITPESIKLFGSYVNRKLGDRLTNDKTAEALLNELFSDALSVFDGNGLSTERNKELILQHMSIVPQIVLKYAGDNPKLSNAKSLGTMRELASEVINASESETTDKFQSVIDRFGGFIGNTNNIFVTDSDPLERFEAISLELTKTSNQEAIYNFLTNSYSDNVLDPKKQFEFSVIRNIINGKNENALKFKLTTLGQVINDENFDNTTGSTDVNLPVLILIDTNDNIALFNSDGTISKKGKYATFTVKTNREALNYQQNMIAKDLLRRGLAKTQKEADKYAAQQVDNFVKAFEENLNKVKAGKTIFMNIDLYRSSIGLAAENRNIQTPLSSVENISTIAEPGKSLIKQTRESDQFYPTISVANSKLERRVFGNPLSSMTDEEFETLHYLLSTPEIKIDGYEDEVANRMDVRKEFIRFFVDTLNFGEGTEYIPITFYREKDGEKRLIIGYLNQEPIPASTLTVAKLKEWASAKYGKPVDRKLGVEEPTPRKSLAEATLGEIYSDEEGNLFEVVGLRRSFTNRRQASMNDFIFKVPVKVEDGILKTGEKITIGEHVIKNGYTTIVPTAENKIIGVGAYLAFSDGIEKFVSDSQDLFKDFGDIKFRSVPQTNSQNISTEKENKDAVDWFYDPNNPLNKVVNLNFLNKVSEYGPNFLANFIGNSINLYLGSQPTDLYHEAFHAYFDGILSSKERQDIYDAIKKTPGSFTVIVEGQRKVVSYDDATNLEIEEFLAERFREFAMSNGKKVTFSNNKVMAFFQKLLALLKNVFGNMSYAEAKAFNKTQAIADAMFTRLYRGEYSADTFNVENAEQKWKSSEIKTTTGDEFSLEEVHDAMSSMKSIMADFVTQGLNVSQNSDQRREATLLLLKMSQVPVTSQEYKDFSNQLDAIGKSSIRTGSGVFSLVSNPKLLSLMSDYIKARLQQRLIEVEQNIEALNAIKDDEERTLSQSTQLNFQKTLLEKMLKAENFGKISDLNRANDEKQTEGPIVEKTLLSLFIKNYSNLTLGKETYVDQYEAEALENDTFVPIFDRGGNDQLFDKTIEKGTLAILDSIHAYTEQGKGVAKINALGFKEILPVKNMIAKVAKLLRNTPDAMNMAEVLKNEAMNKGEYTITQINPITGELEEIKASFNDKEIDQLFRRLGDISKLDFADNMTSMEHRQWSEFWQSFNKADVLLREFILEKSEIEDIDGNVTTTLTSKSGQTQSLSTQVERQWSANFKTAALTGEFSTKNIDGESVLDVESLLGEFADEDKDKQVFGLVEGGGPATIKSKYDRNKLKTSRYTTKSYPLGIANPYLLFNALGITLVDDSDVRKILFEGSSELNVNGAIASYIIDSLNNRMSKVEWDKNTEQYVKDTTSKYVKSLEDVFSKFKYIDENGQIQTQYDLSGYLKQLRELHYVYSNEYTNFSSYTAEGNLASEKSFNSSLLNLTSALNNAKSIEDVYNTPGLEYLNPYTNPQAAASRWLIDMFQLDPELYKGNKRGKRNYAIKITAENLSGSKLINKVVRYSDELNEETGEFETKRFSLETDDGVASMAQDQKTKFTSDFHLGMEGKPEIMRTEAKSTSMTVYASSTKGTEKRSGMNLLVNKDEVEKVYADKYKGRILFNEFKNHLAAEIIRIRQVKKLKSMILSGKIKTEDLVLDVEQLNRAEEWFVFDKIFEKDKNLKDDLLKLNIDSVLSDNKFSIDTLSSDLQSRVENALKEYFKDQATSLRNEMESKLVISDTLLEVYTNVDEKSGESENMDSVKDKMYRAFLINNFIQNLNYTSLFLGDVSTHNVQGENLHKRIAGLISTGKIFRHDGVWLKYINSTEYNAYGFAKKHNEGKTNVNRDYVYSGFLNTAIIKEAKSDSKYIEHYKNMLGIDTAKYNNMEEADGQAWLSFDTYRILQDSIGEWSDTQEEMYQKMLSGKKLEQNEMLATFPVRKFQYYGNVSNQKMEQALKDLGINLQGSAFHKYSLMPLIPALIEGTPLQIMHEKMMEQNIDYVTMKSGSKLSSLSKVKVEKGEVVADLDDFYNAKTRTFNEDIVFTPNVIHVKFLKSQNYIAEGYHGYVTLPTQVRKIATIGIMDGGVPTDFEYAGKKTRKQAWNALTKKEKLEKSDKWRWLEEYTETLDAMEDLLRERLLEDIALKEVVKNGKKEYVGDSSKLANYLKEKLKSKEILPEEISFITNPDGTLIDDLSFSLINDKIEEILVTLVDKTLRSITVNGEALVQVSGTMFEKFQITGGVGISEEMLKSESQQAAALKYGTNGLKFYFLQDEFGNEVLDKDGKAIVKGMDVKISLQGDFKKLLYTENAKGETIAVFTEDENGKKVLDYNASLQRLNDAIKTTYWQDKYGELIKLPGVRIPTQGPNSLVSATVAEFLPEFAGPVIILPTEIVSQSGADFDIDKLFMMFMNINNYNGKVEAVQFKKSDRSYDEIRENIAKVESKEDKADKELQNAWKDYVDYLKEKENLNDTTGPMWAEIKELQNEIDQLYAEKKEVYTNKDYDFEFQKKLHKELQDRIDDKRNQKSTLLNFIKSEVNDFFDAEIKNKKDRADIVNQKYAEFKSNIDNKQKAVDNINEELADLHREMAGKGIKGLENRFFGLLNERILMADNLKHLVTPNSTKDTEHIARNAGSKIKRSYKKRDSLSTTVFDYRYNLLKHQENSVGKDALGIAAVTATFYAIFTTYGATLQETSSADQEKFLKSLQILQDTTKSTTLEYSKALDFVYSFKNKTLNFAKNNGKIGYNLDQEKNALTLGLMRNVDGQEISDILSQLINGYVDVAKDAWIFDAQGTKETTPILLFLLMAGVSVDSAINMVNNPLVLEFNEALKENSGVFAPLGNNSTKYFDSYAATLEAMSDKYGSLFADPLNISKTSSLSNFNVIANTAKAFTNDDLKNRLGEEPNFRDMQILSHFLQIKEMTDAVTEFTMVSKFDTTKISNISEAQERIEKIAEIKARPVSNKIIPNEWFDLILKSPIGKFNNDEFIVDLFSKYFKLRNNKALIIRSLGLKVKGVDKRKVLADFKNDFLWFLYQNAAYGGNSYTTSPTKFVKSKKTKVEIPGKTYKLTKDDSIVGMTINEETGEVKYSANVFNEEKDLLEFYFVRPFFSNKTPKEWVKFRLEYNNLVEASKDLTDIQFKKKYEIFDTPKRTFFTQGSQQARLIILSRAALYNTGNIKAMFDISAGVASIVQNLKGKYPELENYSFFRDIKYDFNESTKKNNIYLPQVKDAQLAAIYRENLEELKNSPHYEVKDLVKRLNHIAIMQSGVNRASKYSMLPIINQAFFEQMIKNEIGMPYVYQVLDELQKSFEARESRDDIDGQIIDQFKLLYQKQVAGAGMRIKVRGANYLVDELQFSKEIKNKESKVRKSNVTILPLGKEATSEQKELLVDYFYADPIKSPQEIAEDISDMKWVIPNKKIIAPKGKNQKELDKALMLLGIDNSGELPQIKYTSKNVKPGFLSVANSEVFKEKFAIKDEAMASSSTKAIGQGTTKDSKGVTFNPKYQSSSAAYANALEKFYPGSLAKVKSTKPQFVSTDKVWVFGSMITANAYSGRNKEEFETAVEKTFNSYHKPLIDKAIEAGVSSFFVGTASGIDEMAIKHLEEKGFKKIVRYSELGTYNEMVTDKVLKSATDPLYDPKQNAVPVIYNTLNNVLDVLYESEKRFTPDWFKKDVTYSELVNEGKEIVEKEMRKIIIDLDKSYRANNYQSFSIQFMKQLLDMPYGRITIGNSLFDSLVEEVLMNFRNTILEKNKNISTPVEPKKSEAQNIYEQLSNKTKSENVILPSDLEDNTTYTGKNFWNDIVPEARTMYHNKLNRATGKLVPMLVAYRGNKAKSFLENYKYGSTVGNPFDFADEKGSRDEAGKISTIKFIHWMTTGENLGNANATEEYRQAIINDILSGKIKGSPILYYQEKNYATHATALDYLINQYNWSASTTQPTPVAKIKEGVSELFESNPELASVGTPEQYSQYLAAIFPNSQLKDIVYRTENKKKGSKFSVFKKGKEDTSFDLGFYFTTKKGAKDLLSINKAALEENGIQDEYDIRTFRYILNFKNPQTKSFKKYFESNPTKSFKHYREDVNEAIQNGYDSLIATNVIDWSNENQYIAFEPEQIHELGTKQDVEGFKEFVSTQPSTSVGTEPKGQKIADGVYVNQQGLTPQEELELFDIIKPVLEEQAVKSNAGKSAPKMAGLSLNWDYTNGPTKRKDNGYTRVNVGETLKPNTTYGWFASSVNGQKLYPITKRLVELMTKATGIDVTNYDGAIVNIYNSFSFIGNHPDVDESITAKNYPVVVVNIGGPGNIIIGTDRQAIPPVQLKSGAGYVFGFKGKNRMVPHSTYASPITGTLPSITTQMDGETLEAGSYRISITMRRVMPLEKGMPSEPAIVSATEKNLRTAAPVLTFNLLPFTAEERPIILSNFAIKLTAVLKKQHTSADALAYINEALAIADEQGQEIIIEKLKECYRK